MVLQKHLQFIGRETESECLLASLLSALKMFVRQMLKEASDISG